ncbi:MAG: amidohydrolase family protein, partial [Bdellovibrionota bacterium]|nr:amidohydrolase family protein [Bdellovibrionota bacterium]
MKQALKSKNIVSSSFHKEGVLVIENDKIVGIFDQVDPIEVDHFEDYGDQYIMPGIVDTHVHVNEPGRTDWEGFETATQAAAAGGITTLVDMPLNCLPVTTTKEAFEIKLEAIKGKLFVDVGFWGGVTPPSLKDLPELLKSGVLGVKSFLIDSGIPEFPPMTEKDLHLAMPLLSKEGVPYLIHAEIDEENTKNITITKKYQTFLDSRPRSWENRA